MYCTHFAISTLLLISVWSCSQDSRPLDTVGTSTPEPTNTPSVQSVPSTPSRLAFLSEEDIREQCLYTDTDVPSTLLEPLHRIVYEHTTRYIPTGKDKFRIERGYFVDPLLDLVDGSHNIVPTPEVWDREVGNHPFLTHDPLPFTVHVKRAPLRPNRVIPRGDHWELTLYGVMPADFFHGGGTWELRADAKMDPDTCEAILERVVAGPDKIVLYPEDET